jgi:hypothetical protein
VPTRLRTAAYAASRNAEYAVVIPNAVPGRHVKESTTACGRTSRSQEFHWA